MYNIRTDKKKDFISYQLVYEKSPEITIKKEMIRVYNKIIEQRQTVQKETREKPILEYKIEN